MSRAKRWCFTVNNPRLTDHPTLWLPEGSRFGFQYERGQQGTPHIQGWVILTEKKSLHAVKQLHQTAHWEVMRGSLQKNIEYCSKSETRDSEYFSNELNLEKKPIQQLQEDVESGSGLREIFSRNFSMSCR